MVSYIFPILFQLIISAIRSANYSQIINETMGIWRSFVLVVGKQWDVLESYRSHTESRRVSLGKPVQEPGVQVSGKI